MLLYLVKIFEVADKDMLEWSKLKLYSMDEVGREPSFKLHVATIYLNGDKQS